MSRFSIENFLSHSAENFRRGILYCCIDFGYRKSLNKRVGSIKNFRRNFLSHSAEKHRKGTLQCFTNFGHQKMLMVNRKNIWNARDSNPKPTAWERCCPNPPAVIYFWIKRVGSFTLQKKEIWPHCTLYWMNNFSCIFHIRPKIKKRYWMKKIQCAVNSVRNSALLQIHTWKCFFIGIATHKQKRKLFILVVPELLHTCTRSYRLQEWMKANRQKSWCWIKHRELAIPRCPTIATRVTPGCLFAVSSV